MDLTVQVSAPILLPLEYYLSTTLIECNILSIDDTSNLRITELQQNLFLIVYHVDTGPVDSNDDFILGKWRSSELQGFIETEMRC